MTETSTSKPRDVNRIINLVTGLVVIVATVVWLGATFIPPLFKAPTEPGRKFVAYFDDAAGVQAGDAVRIQNRRAGHVTGVELAERDGQMQVRVEFTIRPGTSSPWLQTADIPADSRISVRRPRAWGRPRIDIRIGQSSDEIIEEGGEWTNTRGARTDSDLEIWEADRVRFHKNAEDMFAYFENEELVRQIKEGIAGAYKSLKEVESAVQDMSLDTGRINAEVADARKTLEELNTSLSGGRPELREGLEKAAEATDFDEGEFDRIGTWLANFNDTIAGLERTLEQNREQLTDPRLHRQVHDMRRQSAQLRASWVRSAEDPKHGGNMVSWRRGRHFFHGTESPTEIGDWAYNRARQAGAQFED
jgi:hypothetical protein